MEDKDFIQRSKNISTISLSNCPACLFPPVSRVPLRLDHWESSPCKKISVSLRFDFIDKNLSGVTDLRTKRLSPRTNTMRQMNRNLLSTGGRTLRGSNFCSRHFLSLIFFGLLLVSLIFFIFLHFFQHLFIFPIFHFSGSHFFQYFLQTFNFSSLSFLSPRRANIMAFHRQKTPSGFQGKGELMRSSNQEYNV